MEKNKLHSIAPILSEISLKGTGFEIPQNYMSAVEETVISELMLQKKCQKETSSTFKLPENYFDEIEDVVLAKLKTEIVKNKDKLITNEFQPFLVAFEWAAGENFPANFA